MSVKSPLHLIIMKLRTDIRLQDEKRDFLIGCIIGRQKPVNSAQPIGAGPAIVFRIPGITLCGGGTTSSHSDYSATPCRKSGQED